MLQFDDTIAALASPPGPAAVGIIRVSGPDAKSAVEQIFTPHEANRWERCRSARRFEGLVACSVLSMPLDSTASLWPNSRSFTGQPTVELSTVGSLPVLNAVLSALYGRGTRPAEPGEFTLRAFLSGRINLMQAEAVLGVIDADSPGQLRLALEQLAGGMSAPLAELHEQLLCDLADLEAGLDFVEEDIEFVSRETLVTRCTAALAAIDSLTKHAEHRTRSAGTHRVAIAGLANAGKSTLFNRLTAGRALVSPQRGTTRDYLSATTVCDGVEVEFVDTAGWERTADELLQSALAARRKLLGEVELIVWCTASDFSPAEQRESATALDELSDNVVCPVLPVATKCDTGPNDVPGCQVRISLGSDAERGLTELRRSVAQELSAGEDGALLGTTAARCREILESARMSLLAARELAQTGGSEELMAVELRRVIDHLGRIVGRVYTDDLLDRIFSRFCIGK